MSIFLASCFKKPMYHVVVHNLSGSEMQNVSVAYQTFTFGMSTMSKNRQDVSLYVGERHPFPEVATILWTTPDGQHHDKQIDVKKAAPKKFKNLFIYFHIYENDVKVRFTEEFTMELPPE